MTDSKKSLRRFGSELKEKTEALTDQGKMMAEMTTKVMEEAAKERMELTSKHYEEVERAKTVWIGYK